MKTGAARQKEWRDRRNALAKVGATYLIARLVVCSASLSLRAEAAQGEHKTFYADRAEQCRKWAADIRDGGHIDVERIEEALAEFEALASA